MVMGDQISPLLVPSRRLDFFGIRPRRVPKDRPKRNGSLAPGVLRLASGGRLRTPIATTCRPIQRMRRWPLKRFTKSDRLVRITESGGVPEIEDAVTKALQSLNRTQQPDGSWPGGPGMTALAVLAYLGQGEAMLSPEFGEPCLKGIVALINLATKNDGHFSSTPADKSYSFDHGIATYALAEAAVWCKQVRQDIPNLDDTVRRAGQIIIDHQHTAGGWEQGYEKTSDGGGDLGITAWQFMALRACFMTKLEFRDLPPCVVRSLKFVESLQIESDALANAHQRTCLGVLMLEVYYQYLTTTPQIRIERGG